MDCEAKIGALIYSDVERDCGPDLQLLVSVVKKQVGPLDGLDSDTEREGGPDCDLIVSVVEKPAGPPMTVSDRKREAGPDSEVIVSLL